MIRYEIVPYTRGRVLELGCDGRRTFPHFITVDEGCGENWRPDVITNLKDLSMFSSQSMDAVYASHIIEHIDEKEKAVGEWWRVLKHGGYLIFHFDNSKMVPGKVIEVMKGGGSWDLVLSEPANGYLQVYKKGGKEHLFSYTEDKPKKTCGIFRHGGFGDMIQMSPILPVLKEQGYHIVLYTSPYAYQVVERDPHIDEFIVMDKDQVPNQELPYFWQYLSGVHTKFVNLSESVEGSLLAMRGRTPQWWDKAAVDVYMSHNYEDFAHKVVGVPKKYSPKFYETPKETKWANKIKRKHKKLVLWALAGSSVHKVYPWLDQVVARFMLETSDVDFVFVGNELCQLIEEPWKDEKRVVRLSGKASIRESMALAKISDVVVGPETGILNAVSHEPTPKVIMLSHSSEENLTKYWKHCVSLMPENCSCYPCHKMIYGFDNCVRDDESGVALCQAKISPENVIAAIKEQLDVNV